MAVSAPSIAEVVWYASDGRVRVTWQGVGYTSTRLYRRVRGTASWGSPVATMAAGASQTIVSGQSLQTDYEWAMSGTTSEGTSPLSSPTRLDRAHTPVPSLETLTRDAPSGSLGQGWATWTATPVGVTTITAIIIEARRTGSGQAFTQVNQVVNNGAARVPVTDGSSRWDVRVSAHGSAGRSVPSRVMVLEPWWQRPDSVDAQTPTRNGSGQVVLGWSRNVTARAPYNSIEIWQAPLASGDFRRVATLAGTATSWTDQASVAHRGARYQIIPRNSSTERVPSSIQTLTVQPSLTRPSAPSSVTVTAQPDGMVLAEWPAVSDATLYRVWMLPTGQSDPSAVSWPLATTSRSVRVGDNWAGRFAVQSLNAAGESEALSPWSGTVATTPAGATRVTARRSGADVLIDWTAPTTIATGWEAERSTDGQTGWSLAGTASSGTARRIVFSGASLSVPHYVRVRPTRGGYTPGPDEGWTYAAYPVPAGAAPLAPTPLTSGYVPLAETVPVEWQHQPTDDTPQQAASIEWRRKNGATQVASGTATTTTASTWSAPSSAFVSGHVTEYRVRTRGTSASFSPWSPWTALTPVARPTVTITGPSTTVATLRPLATWTAASQQSARVRLLDADGNAVNAWELGSQKSQTLTVVDRATYTVEVAVFDGRLWSPTQTRVFSVVVVRPLPPAFTADPQGSAVRFTVGAAPWVQGRRNYALARDLSDWTTANVWATSFDEGPSGVLLRPVASGVNAFKEHYAYGNLRVAFDAYSPDGAQVVVGWRPVNDVISQSVTTTGSWTRYEVTINGGTIFPQAGPEVSLRVLGGDVYLRNLVVTSGDNSGAYFDGATEADGHLYVGATASDHHSYHVELVESPSGGSQIGPLVERTEILRLDGDRWVSVAWADNGEAWDTLPRLCQPETYIARNHSAESYADSHPVIVRVEHRDSVLNYGPNLSQQVTCGPISTPGSGRTRAREERLYAGYRYATVYESDVTSPGRLRVDATLFPRNSSTDEWIAALATPGEKLLRTPSGLVMLGNALTDSWDHGTRFRSSVGFEFVETGPRP